MHPMSRGFQRTVNNRTAGTSSIRRSTANRAAPATRGTANRTANRATPRSNSAVNRSVNARRITSRHRVTNSDDRGALVRRSIQNKSNESVTRGLNAAASLMNTAHSGVNK